MNLKNLKQRLSMQNLWQSLQHVVLRFPVAVSFLTGLTILLSYIMIAEPGEVNTGIQCLLVFLSVGILISLAASLWGEELPGKRMRWIKEGVALALWGGYTVLLFYTEVFPNKGLPAFMIGNVAWIAAVIILIPFGSFLREKDDLKSWHFMLSLFASLIVSGLVTWGMTGGLEGLLYGTAALFDFKTDERFSIIIMIFCAVLLWGLLFLALIPQAERKHNNSAEMPSFLLKSVSWLLIPLLWCYIVVLYAYGINILVHWELPKGMISWLISAVMAGYIFCYILLYPQVTNKQSWQSKMLTCWLPIAILPLLLLMSVGVTRRFMDYGITAPRLYLLTLLLWFYAICIAMLVMPRKRFRWIFLSLGALLLLTSGHPFNYYRICRPILAAKIDRTISDKGIEVPFKLNSLDDNPSLTSEEADDLFREITHMRSDYGDDFVSRWIRDDVPADTSELTDDDSGIWLIYYENNQKEYPCPQGYLRYQPIHDSFTYSTDTFPEKRISNGILPVVCKKDIVLQFDTAAIRHASNHAESIIIYSADNHAAFVPTSVKIHAFNNHTIDSYYSGFLFWKDK